MDVVAHGLWSNILIYKKYPSDAKRRWIAVAFGVLPDLLAFTPVFLYVFFTKQQFWDVVNSSHWTVRYAPEAYNYTHSLVVFVAVFLIVTGWRMFLYAGKGWGTWIYFPMLAWALHILMDIPTHPDFYRTPFLFPLSNYRFPYGLSWGHAAILIPQYILLAIWYGFWYFKWRKRKT